MLCTEEMLWKCGGKEYGAKKEGMKAFTAAGIEHIMAYTPVLHIQHMSRRHL